MAIAALHPKRLQAYNPRLVTDPLMKVKGIRKGLKVGFHLHNRSPNLYWQLSQSTLSAKEGPWRPFAS